MKTDYDDGMLQTSKKEPPAGDYQSRLMLRFASLGVAFFLLLVLPYLLHGGVLDDAYIFCRYAENLLSGNGLVFNLGERVEGITSFLHTIVVSGGMAAGLDGASAARAASVSAAFLVLGLLSFGRFDGSVVGPSAALLTAVSAPFFMWSSSGMDEALFAVVTLAAVLMAGRDLDDPDCGGLLRWSTWLLIGTTYLVRPEGLVVIGAIVLVGLRGLIRRVRETTTWVGPMIAILPVAALTIFRLAYYGYPVPNTYYAKVGGGSWQLMIRGLQYAADVVVVLGPVILLGALGWRQIKNNSTARLGIAVSALLLLAAVFSGGDIFPLARLAVPTVPLLALVSAFSLHQLIPARSRFFLAISASAVVTLGWTMNAPVPFLNGLSSFGVDGFHSLRVQAVTWDQVGRDLRHQLGPDRSIALSPAGAIPFRSGWKTIDMLGLVDQHVSHLDISMGQGVAGHEKYDVSYVLSREPDFILLHTMLCRTPVDPDFAAGKLDMDAEIAMAGDSAFQTQYRPVWLEITQGFLLIYVRV